ncbi:MAG: hypothetical protein KME60_13475 [Cyanomargarita calcarea GSE-NOS-MK-12-04C]|jgi:hypothetical protein|uniref:Uncharacterized protein n=1 Tax=Cyanomargarita calcarea GSE-NOS-MK-12-04C TaxID=2839659 RepID=A0A951USZ4_9CYAN|nr:hypothetical protein [Cyanomargarita calcarea GSE-NOS-MK-12-04C]
MKWLNRNPMFPIMFFAGCVIFALSRSTIEANMQSSNMVQAANRSKSEKEKQIDISEALLAKQEQIAASRFRNGCIMVVAQIAPNKFTGLTEGLPVIDQVRKTPLAPNNIVCDANGGTAVIVRSQSKPVVGEVFFTGNLQLIEKAKKRANARYVLPNQ